MKEDGIIAGHDYMMGGNKHGYGVIEAVHQFYVKIIGN